MAVPVFVVGVIANQVVRFLSKKTAQNFIKNFGRGKGRIVTDVNKLRTKNPILGYSAQGIKQWMKANKPKINKKLTTQNKTVKQKNKKNNIITKFKNVVNKIRAENKKLGDNALTKDEAIVAGTILGPGTVAMVTQKKMGKKEQIKKKKRLGLIRGKK